MGHSESPETLVFIVFISAFKNKTCFFERVLKKVSLLKDIYGIHLKERSFTTKNEFPVFINQHIQSEISKKASGINGEPQNLQK